LAAKRDWGGNGRVDAKQAGRDKEPIPAASLRTFAEFHWATAKNAPVIFPAMRNILRQFYTLYAVESASLMAFAAARILA
jgi:hypothetical protein